MVVALAAGSCPCALADDDGGGVIAGTVTLVIWPGNHAGGDESP